MAIKFEKIQQGMTLYDVRKNNGFGNYTWCIWPVKVVEVDSDNRKVLASWNGNKASWMDESRVTKYRARQPEQKKKY